MTDIDPTQMKQQAFGTPKPPHAGSAQGGAQAATVPSKGSDKGAEAKPTKTAPIATKPRKRGQRVEQPEMTVAKALAEGLPKDQVDELLDQWKKYRRQLAKDEEAKAEEAMQAKVVAGRRAIADELLKLADGYGCTMAEAKEIYAEALAAKFSNKVKGK